MSYVKFESKEDKFLLKEIELYTIFLIESYSWGKKIKSTLYQNNLEIYLSSVLGTVLLFQMFAVYLLYELVKPGVKTTFSFRREY